MKRGLTGYLLPIASSNEPYRAFVPHPLPPNPSLVLDEHLHELLHQATLSLGRLDGITALLSDPTLFIYTNIRKEAVLSSQIEGTQSSLSDLLLFENEEAPGVPLDDVQEVSNYVAALNHGLKRLREGWPITLRVIKEIHAVLLSKGRGANKEPGEFRHSQNWIGGSRPGNAKFVPPPPDYLLETLGALEKFLHNDPVKTPLLLKAGLAHVQFETIHPFLDGNGRLGRLLITLLMCSENTLRQPILYLSLYLKANRSKYYDLLQRVRLEGEWETWLEFFLNGIRETSDEAGKNIHRLVKLFESDRQRIQKIGRAAGSALRVHDFFQSNPVAPIAKIAAKSGLSIPAVTTAIKYLEKLSIVKEMSGKRRHRLFAYQQHLKILSEGTEPLK
ncbi:MAG: Fic family protein [Verrucomicrobiota bacterium]